MSPKQSCSISLERYGEFGRRGSIKGAVPGMSGIALLPVCIALTIRVRKRNGPSEHLEICRAQGCIGGKDGEEGLAAGSCPIAVEPHAARILIVDDPVV